MPEDVLNSTNSKSIGWYEVAIPVRGCNLSLENIKDAYRDLHLINKRFGDQVITKLKPEPDLTDDQWEERKTYLLEDAFRLTVTVNGFQDQKLYGESVEVFDHPNLPKPISSIFITNATAFQRHANGSEPIDHLTVFLDFGKPEVFDPNPLVSAATPNEGMVTVKAQDIGFFNSVQLVVTKKLTARRTWYGAIHRNFAYDIGMWLIALPVSLYFSAYYMDQLIPVGDTFELFRWPLFFYFVGLSLLFYRALTAYLKWAFPVNVLEDNKDSALKHRLALGAITSWIFYQIASTVYALVSGQS